MYKPELYISESNCEKDPIRQFRIWMEEASAGGESLPESMHLATSGKDNTPSSRVVLLKYILDNSFVFFTNLESRKAKELAQNPRVALTFHWKTMERQVRIEGIAHRTSEELADRYFISRPEGSRISSWISPQSRSVPSRDFLEKKYQEFSNQKNIQNTGRPPYWGGFAVKPRHFEFWQGRPDRLHDRICYQLENGSWRVFRLAP